MNESVDEMIMKGLMSSSLTSSKLQFVKKIPCNCSFGSKIAN